MCDALGMTISPTAIRVASGRLVDLLYTRLEDVLLSDIAAGLAHQERFTGHCPLHPTVAQHSLAVEHIAVELWCRSEPAKDPDRGSLAAMRRAALLHDAAEAYVSDVSSPAKRALRAITVDWYSGESNFDSLEGDVQAAIDARFDCAPGNWAGLVKEADDLAYLYESKYADWGEPDRELPDWLKRDLYVARCYGEHPQSGEFLVDGGEAAFLRRAAALGMRDTVPIGTDRNPCDDADCPWCA
jgi:5'-deoxynucleotidase YfbR-like HD superfamily hydrolase